jgi:ankyrin repeat protein
MIFETARALQLRSTFLISVISGYTALMWSSYNGCLETTRFLVESGANVEAKTNE